MLAISADKIYFKVDFKPTYRFTFGTKTNYHMSLLMRKKSVFNIFTFVN